jgi:hypothetical protein
MQSTSITFVTDEQKAMIIVLMNLILIPPYAKYMFNLDMKIKNKIGELIYFFLQTNLYEPQSDIILRIYNLIKNIYANDKSHFVNLSKLK